MNVSGTHRMTSILALVALLAGCAANPTPTTTHDGLVLETSVRYAEVYRKPGASLASYKAFSLEPCTVAFRENWLRDQQRNRVDLSRSVTRQDVERIRETLAGDCDGAFRSALLREPAYTLVDDSSQDPVVLVLRPAIINLDIAAPDTLSAGSSRSYTTSAGEMTLVLEMRDATTGETLVRAVDRKRAPDRGSLQWTNSVTNRADADRALRHWADRLRQALDAATAD